MTGKKGTPSPNSGKGLAVEFLRANVRYREARCLTWPYSRNEIGYGQFGYRGRMVQRAKRLRDEGVPLETIGSLLGVSRSTARNFVSE